MVGAARFELATPCAQDIRSPHLRINRFNNLRTLLVGPCGNFSYNLGCNPAMRPGNPPTKPTGSPAGRAICKIKQRGRSHVVAAGVHWSNPRRIRCHRHSRNSPRNSSKRPSRFRSGTPFPARTNGRVADDRSGVDRSSPVRLTAYEAEFNKCWTQLRRIFRMNARASVSVIGFGGGSALARACRENCPIAS